MPINFQPDTKIDFQPESTTIDFRPEQDARPRTPGALDQTTPETGNIYDINTFAGANIPIVPQEPQTTDEPIISEETLFKAIKALPAIDNEYTLGAKRSLAKMASGLTTSKGVLSTALAPFMPALVGSYFAIEGISGVKDLAIQSGEDWDKLTKAQKGERIGDMVLSGAIPVAVLLHAHAEAQKASAAANTPPVIPVENVPLPKVLGDEVAKIEADVSKDLTAEQKGVESDATKIRQQQESDVLQLPQTEEGRIPTQTAGSDNVKQGGQVQAEETPIESMGAATLGSAPSKATIEALTDSFKGVEGEKVPIKEQIQRAWDAFTPKETGKEALSAAVQGLKATGDFIVSKFENIPTVDQMDRIKGDLTREIEANGHRMFLFAREAKKAMPDIKDREALSKFVDAGGDPAILQQEAAMAPQGREGPYIRAQNLSPEEKVAAQNIVNYFEQKLKEAIDAGVVNAGIEDYIHRIFEKDSDWKKGALAKVQAGLLDTSTPALARRRFFELDAEAEAAGYKVVGDFIPRIVAYESALTKAIASRAAVKAMTEVKMPDGRPMLAVSGMGKDVPAGQTPAEATLINPRAKPEEYKDYVDRPYPALKRWKWVGKGIDEQPVFLQGDVAVHPDAVKRIDRLLKPSAIRESKVGRTALAASSTFKNTMLDLSLFHQVQERVHALEHRVGKVFNAPVVQEIDLNDPTVNGLLKGGMTIGGNYNLLYDEGVFGKSLARAVPGLRAISDSYHDWLFRDYIPRLKTTMALHALERNRKVYPKLSEEQLYKLTAEQANAAFGGLNYIMMERSATLRDTLRLTTLAPDFLEARGRFVAQALTKTGREQLVALGFGALAMYTMARIANKMIDDDYHFEAENAFNVVHNGRAYGLRTVQGDILHLLEQPVRFWMHRLNPVFTKPLLELATQRDEFGRKRSFFQVLGDTASNIVPIALRSSVERSLFESMLNSLGITEHRYNEIDKVYDLAKEFKENRGIEDKGEFIYDRDKDPLRRLKIALSQDDIPQAKLEIEKLLKDEKSTLPKLKDHFKRYANSPFTGSKRTDAEFYDGLRQDQKLTFDRAKEHKRKIYDNFREAIP